MDSMPSGNRCKLPRKAGKRHKMNLSHKHIFTSICVVCWKVVLCIYLNDKCMCVGDLVLRGHVLLHSLAGAPDGQEDECVGQEDDSAWHNVAEEEEADDVAHSRRVLAGCMPVDAARCSVGLGSILSPARQRTYSKNSSVAPHPSNQQAGVAVGELVT